MDFQSIVVELVWPGEYLTAGSGMLRMKADIWGCKRE